MDEDRIANRMSDYLSTEFCTHLMSLMAEEDYNKTIDLLDEEIISLCDSCDERRDCDNCEREPRINEGYL